MSAQLSLPIYLPKAPPPNTMSLALEFQHMNSEEYKHSGIAHCNMFHLYQLKCKSQLHLFMPNKFEYTELYYLQETSKADGTANVIISWQNFSSPMTHLSSFKITMTRKEQVTFVNC